jgi:dienelactone hydrolase
MTGPADPSRPEIERLHAFPGEAAARAALRPLAPEDAWPGLPTERLELISRGDLVPGLLARKPRTTAKPGGAKPALLLAVHDAGDSVRSSDILAAASWVGPELAVVAIDLPLHGHRASPKLTERLVAGIARRERGGDLDRNGAGLVEEFWRQATIDLMRTLDAVLALDALDPKRIGLLGVGLGAALGQTLMAHDPRPSAAVLVHPASAPAASVPVQGSSPRPAAAPEILTLEREVGPEVWAPRARAFLASRLGF